MAAGPRERLAAMIRDVEKAARQLRTDIRKRAQAAPKSMEAAATALRKGAADIAAQVADKLVAEVVLNIAREGEDPVSLRPARHLHLLQNEWTTEVAIYSTWSGDFYSVLHAGLGDGRVSMTFAHNPMIRWIWVGGVLVALSAIVAILPSQNRRRARATGPMEQFASDASQ